MGDEFIIDLRGKGREEAIRAMEELPQGKKNVWINASSTEWWDDETSERFGNHLRNCDVRNLNLNNTNLSFEQLCDLLTIADGRKLEVLSFGMLHGEDDLDDTSEEKEESQAQVLQLVSNLEVVNITWGPIGRYSFEAMKDMKRLKRIVMIGAYAVGDFNSSEFVSEARRLGWDFEW